MADLRRARERQRELPRVALVHQGTVEQGERLLAPLWPDALAVADPARTLYSDFGLGRGRLARVMGPSTWLSGLRALRRGHFVGKPVGDPLVMPGLFLVHEARVLWRREFAHSGDRPGEQELLAAASSTRTLAR